MGNSFRALFFCNPGKRLGDDRPRHRGPQQIFAFIYSSGFQRRPDVFGNEFFTQIFDINFAGAGFERFVLDEFKIIALPHVGAHSDDFITIVLNQPGNDDRRVQATGVCQHYFFSHFFLCFAHMSPLQTNITNLL